MLVEFVIDVTGPYRRILNGQMLAHVLNSLRRCHDADHMNVGGMALGDERLIGQFHRRAGSEHRIHNDQCLAVEARASDILDVNDKVISLGEVFPVSRHKGVLSAIKEI